MSQLLFPQNKEDAGPAYWKVIHNTAALYPDNPNETQKENARFFYSYLTENFVCPDCVNHAKEYMSNNKPDFSSRKSLSTYFCNMHNAVNERLGKKKHDCSKIVGGVQHDHSTCTTCTVKKSGLINDLEDYKKTARNIILSMCKEESIAPPSIHFQPCPDSASTSCITYDHNRMKDGVYFGEADIYINPYSASLRTIFHEAKHYVDLKKGNSLDEVPTDTFAIDTINTHFNFDNYNNTPTVNDRLMDESSNLLPIKNDVFPTRNVKYDVLNVKTYYDYPSLQRINNMFDKGAGYNAKQTIEHAENEPNKNIFVPDNNDDFILSGLNGIFAWPASLVGVSPSSMTSTYVSSFVTNVLMYLIRSNFSTFGTSVISLMTSISLFGGAAFFKNSIGSGDRGFIQGIVAMFLSAGINNLVPSKREVMAEGLRLFIEGVKTFDLGKIKESLFFDEEAFTINKNIKPGISDEKAQKIANALRAKTAYIGASGGVSDIRDRQLASRSQYDATNYPSPIGAGDKNTIPNYGNSDLSAIARSYERKRALLDASGGTLDNLDIDTLTSELSSGLDEIDTNSYEVLQM